MGNKDQPTTGICTYDADSITVRNHDLVHELMGKLTFTKMILLQLSGKLPTQQQTFILDAVLVTIMEHGLVPSAVVTRLTHYGAPESLQGAVAAGLLGVGDRFAGTASECAQLLDTLLGSPESERQMLAKTLVQLHREQKKALPGFGHSMHKQADPRVARLLAIASEAGCKGQYLEALHVLAAAIKSELGKELVINVSAAIAVVLREAGIESSAIRGLILIARCAGLTGHVCEEMANPAGEALWRGAEKAVPYVPQS